MAQLVKKPPAMRETWVRSLAWEDPWEKGKATHSSFLAWEIPWTEKRREAKGKGEKERYIHLNAEFQRIASLLQQSMQRNRRKE